MGTHQSGEPLGYRHEVITVDVSLLELQSDALHLNNTPADLRYKRARR